MTLPVYLDKKIFQPVYKYSKKIANSNRILVWKRKGQPDGRKRQPDESIKPPAASFNSLAAVLSLINTKLRVQLDSHCLKKDKATFAHVNTVVNILIVNIVVNNILTNKKVVNVLIVYQIKLWSYMTLLQKIICLQLLN